MARHSFDTLDLSLDEYFEHLRARAIQPTVVLSSNLHAIHHQSGEQWTFPVDCDLILNTDLPGTDRVKFEYDEDVYEARAADMTRSAHPTPDVLAHIYSGNAHFCASTKAKLDAKRAAVPKATVEDVELQVIEVRTAQTQSHLMGIEGGLVSLQGGESFDVGIAINMDDFVVIRKTRKEEHAIVKIEDLESSSSILTDDSGLPVAQNDEIDLASSAMSVQELHLVCKDVYACGSRGMKLPLKKGDKVLVHARGNDAVWLRDTKGRSGVLTAEMATSNLMNLKVDQGVVTNPEYPESWSLHTLHNDHIVSGDDASSESIFKLPRTKTGLPLPPPDAWALLPPQSEESGSGFGNWEFASEDDKGMAASLSMTSADAIVFAANLGQAGLGGIKVIWTPGNVEGSQGPGFGACSAYIHVYMIDFRRKWAFGQDPVSLGELPVYAGSDEFWFEAKGADTGHLNGFRTQAIPNTIPTEQSLFEAARNRQGFAARQIPTPSDCLKPTPTSAAAMQWKTNILQASDRSVQLAQQLANDHPIDPDRALDLRTSFHPRLADCGYHVKMPDNNYLLQDLKSVQQDLFKPGKKSLSVVEAGFPLLNADGESTTTIVMSQKKQVYEVQLIDIPHLPKAIAPDEDFSMLEAFHRHTKDWQQIGGRMNEKERNYTNAYNSEVWRIRHTYRLLEKQTLGGESLNKDEKAHFLASVAARPLTQAHHNLNTLRGCAPGIIDPAQGPNAVVADPAGNQVVNWVDYPDCDPSPTERLKRHHVRAEKNVLESRSKLVKKQAQAQGQAVLGDGDSGDDDDDGDEGEGEQD
ncbi:hypothetical protein PRZ48_007412 [Zasmidium cellare]|uniref:Uncharacterized protein n=1 Tax=Zasmidium cellare TaxID=395010 RepID=A0ABR0EK47_ZASCE|nr:hypothetical protein PRZ48_007412 [Zasmidium cellare]